MQLTNTVTISLRAIRRNKMRSFLTALGIIIGVGSVIAMVSIGAGARTQIQTQIAALGENVILVFAGNFSPGGVRSGWGGAGTLTVADAKAIKNELSKVAAASPDNRAGAQLIGGIGNWFTGNLLGEDETYLGIRQWPLAQGESFTREQINRAAKVAIIGRTIADQLFPGEDPIGTVMRIRNVPFEIIGILSPKGLNMMGQDQDDVVIIPYTTFMKRVTGRTNLSGITVQVENKNDLGLVQAQIADLLRQRHKILPPREDDFKVLNQEEIAALATATTNVMTAMLGATAGVSLLVGGIGIMNIMLVSVTERTREIGIRIAVGAHGKDILVQFLIEAATISSTGGIIGILFGIGLASAISSSLHWPSVITIQPIVIAFLFSAAVGIFFGFYPARKASRLDPIEALRYE